MGQIELFDIQNKCKQITRQIQLFEKELFNHLIVCKQMTDVSDTYEYLELLHFVD